MTITESLIDAAKKLRDAGVAQPEREAASLLMFTLDRDRTFLFAHSEYMLTDGELQRHESYLARRSKREPFQHIVGKQEFYGLDFEVSPDVLIPRPETELLVETVIEFLKEKENARVCEIGTGSGCIVVAVLHGVPEASAVAVDISDKALAIAQRNAQSNGVTDRIDFQLSDIFADITDQRFDVIVSNPPYIPARDIAGLQSEVRDFDPIIALTDGGDGLSIIRRIVADAPRYLKQNGALAMEFGFGQAVEVAAMFDQQTWNEPLILDDLNGIERVVMDCLK